jgi:non-heme chloroperoxidase
MPFATVGSGSQPVQIYYEDHGTGDPVVLVHGWPMNLTQWEKQVPVLLDAGFRVITYDRRGFGRSDRPATGYDYSTLSDDLDGLLDHLDLQKATLVGFSMGGGEVAHYLARHGNRRIRRVVFIGSITPHLEASPTNPGGVPPEVFAGMKQAIAADRPAFVTSFLQNLYNTDELLGARISEDAVRATWHMAISGSALATQRCVDSFGTDLRPDLVGLALPALVVHGDKDRIVPYAGSGERMPGLVPSSRLVVIEGAPHGLLWTHADQLNQELLEFLRTA